MDIPQLLFLLIVVGVVAGLAALWMILLGPAALRQRLGAFAGRADSSGLNERWIDRIARLAQPLTKLSAPEEGWEKSPLRTRFINAGWRSAAVPSLYFGSKTLLALLLPAVAALVIVLSGAQFFGENLLFMLFLSATFGYYLPNVVLTRVVEYRKRDIFENIPDALDLLTVCVEAGLSLERALVKVASEIHIKSAALAQEIQLVLMEMRTGFTREKALRNFALRSGVEEIDTLVSMLIQSEQFGTSVGDSLRVHSENLRTKRRLLAEERAAKIGLKLLFPLIFCIFPTLLMVLLGPGMIKISRALGPALTGGGP